MLRPMANNRQWIQKKWPHIPSAQRKCEQIFESRALKCSTAYKYELEKKCKQTPMPDIQMFIDRKKRWVDRKPRRYRERVKKEQKKVIENQNFIFFCITYELKYV